MFLILAFEKIVLEENLSVDRFKKFEAYSILVDLHKVYTQCINESTSGPRKRSYKLNCIGPP